VRVEPPLSAAEVAYLTRFSQTRRMDRARGPYFVGGSGFRGQGTDHDVRDFNRPPAGQPGLWCQWVPTEDGAAIEWDGGEKFYAAEAWMAYLLEHFVGHDPVARRADPQRFAFLQGHTCNGEIEAQGEAPDDRWGLVVEDNRVRRIDGRWVWTR
jgi:hypothetical protein